MFHTSYMKAFVEGRVVEMNESELVKASIDGDRDAFCDLYDLYRVRLYRYAYYRLSDKEDAEDAVSSCVLSAWEQIGRLRDPEAFPAWIFRIMRGSCVKLIKDQINRKKAVSVEPGTSQDLEMSAILMEALDTLDEETREMVLLSAVGGLTSKEIGEMYEMPQGTVRSKLSRSYAAMRKLMEAGNEQ